jgi:hypothetical protein
MGRQDQGGHVNKSNEVIELKARPSRAGLAEWLAIGAVAAGSVGAVVGMANSRRSSSRSSDTPASESSNPESFTSPHGDKLRGAVV